MIKRISLLIFAWLIIHNVSRAQDQPEELLVSLKINQIDQQKELIILKFDTQWYTRCQDLEDTYLDPYLLKLSQFNSQTYCLLNTEPITTEFNDANQTLNLITPSTMMKSSNILNQHKNLTPQHAPFGTYLNYDLLYRKISQQNNLQDLNLKNDLNVFWGNYLFQNSIIMRQQHLNNEKTRSFTRLFSQLSFENTSKLSTLYLGDNITPSSPISRGVYFAGLQYGTSFMQRPGFVYWNIPTIQGSALTPSNIDLYINGVNSYSSRVNPGEFNIESGAFFNGDGKAQMIIEDVLGNKTVQNIDLSMTDQLLKKGLRDYNISVGRLRYNFDEDSADYRDYFANIYYRKGITNKFNLGISSQFSKDLKNLGIFSSNYVQNIGILNIGAAYSQTDQQHGYKMNIGWSKNTARYSFGFNSEFTNKNFRSLGLDKDMFLPKFDNFVYFGVHRIPYIGQVTLNYVEQIQHQYTNTSDRRIFSIRGGRPLNQSLYFNYGLNYELGNDKDSYFDLSISYQFDFKRTAYINYSKQATSLNYNKVDQELIGIDYNIGAGTAKTESFFNADSTFKSSYADLNVSYYQNDNNYQAQLNVRGAAAFIDGSFNLTKAIEYPFSLVRLENQSNVDIYKNNEFIGKTNKKGELFVHRLVPYSQHSISFNENQLPIEYGTPLLKQNLVPYPLRGYVIDFPVFKAPDLQFKIIDESGKVLPAGSLITTKPNSVDKIPLGQQGLVTLYGLIEGTNYEFTVQTSDFNSCSFHYNVIAKQNSDIILITCK